MCDEMKKYGKIRNGAFVIKRRVVMFLVILSVLLVLIAMLLKSNVHNKLKNKIINRLLSSIILLVALDISVTALFDYFGFNTVYLFILMLVFPIISYGIVKYSQIQYGRLTKENILALVLLIVTFLGFTSILFWAWKQPVVTMSPDYIKISGVYGVEIPLKKVKTISLRNSLPEILNKMSGLELGDVLKGNYQLNQLGKARLSLYLNREEYIYISTDKNYYIINCKDDQKTKELYQSILLFYPK